MKPHPNDRRTLHWMLMFQAYYDQPVSPTQLKHYRNWSDPSSGRLFLDRMRREGFVDEGGWVREEALA